MISSTADVPGTPPVEDVTARGSPLAASGHLPYRNGVTATTGLHVGLAGSAELVVSRADTAAAVGSGDVEVLATPRLVALCEEATTRAVEGALPSGWTTVAMRVRFDHLAPVAIGTVVRADATVHRIEGKRVVFTVSASDASGLVGAGRVTRVAVERDRFLAKAR